MGIPNRSIERWTSFADEIGRRVDAERHDPAVAPPVVGLRESHAIDRLTQAVETGLSRPNRKKGDRPRAGAESAKIRMIALLGCRCEACATQMPSKALVHLHHVVPVRDGGTTADANLMLLCPNCHSRAHWIYRNLNQHERPATRQALADLLYKVRTL